VKYAYKRPLPQKGFRAHESFSRQVPLIASTETEEDETVTQREWPAEHLLLAAQAGDPASISAVLSASHPHVQRFARTLCSTPEDAAQDALIILFHKVGSLRATGALASWLFQIVRNECIRRYRRAPLLATLPETSTASSAEDDALERLELARVAAAIAALPPDLRQVLILRDVQGHSGRTVANALSLTLPAMKSRLHRARTTVRAALDESTTR
jgi:RNA polymerase sigma factor (sigma-70 family)